MLTPISIARSGFIASGQVGWPHVASGAIQSGDVGNSSVLSGGIGSGQVASGHLASGLIGALGATILTSGQIGSGLIASGAVQGFFGTTRHIASGTVGSFDFGSGAVTTGTIGSGAVVSGNIASGSIGHGHFSSGAVLSGDIGSGQIATFHIASGQLTGFELGSGSIVSGRIASGQIGAGHLADSSVQSGEIASGQVGHFHISSGAITSGSIAMGGTPDGTKIFRDDFTWVAPSAPTINSGDIGSGKIASGAVQGFFGSTRHVASGTIGVFDFGSGAVTAGAIGSGAVVSGNVASGQLGTNHIAAAGIQAGNMASGSVLSGNIASGQIGRFHVASGQLAGFELGSGAIISGRVASGQIGFGHLANGAVQSGSIASGQIFTYHFASGATAPRAMFVGPFFSGLPWTMITEEIISGVRAVAISPSGNLRVAMASVSGRMPAIGVVIDNVLSGIQADVYSIAGDLPAPGSGLTDFSGYIGGPLYVGRSGHIVTASGSFNSGGLLSGDYPQPMGTVAASGSLNIYTQPGVHFGGAGVIIRPSDAGIIVAIGSGAIGSGQIVSGSVQGFFGTVRNIASGTVGSFDFGSGAVMAGAMGSGSVVSGNVASGQIGSIHHASGQLTGFELGSGAIVSGRIASGQIGSMHIGSGQLTGFELGSGAIVSGRIASGQIGSMHIGSGQLTGFELGSGSIVSGRIASGQIGSIHHASGQLTGFELGSGAIVSGRIASGQIGHFHLGSGVITSGSVAMAGTPDGSLFFRDDFTWAAPTAAVGSGGVAQTAFASGISTRFASPIVSGLGAFLPITEEIISGIRAVQMSPSGGIRVAMASVSGRMPAVGVVLGNVLSGIQADVFTLGFFAQTVSGLLDTSGYGQLVYVGRSGQVVTASGLLNSGGLLSGDISQPLGILTGSGQVLLSVAAMLPFVPGQIISGNVASGQLSTYHFASGTLADRTMYGNPIASGLTHITLITEEIISGVRAVCISQSGNIRVAMASVSGRMPAVGIVVDNVLSGIQPNVYTLGAFQFSSGMADYSGWLGKTVFVGRSGEVVQWSGSFNSGGLNMASGGDFVQRLGKIINSGAIIANVDQDMGQNILLGVTSVADATNRGFGI